MAELDLKLHNSSYPPPIFLLVLLLLLLLKQTAAEMVQITFFKLNYNSQVFLALQIQKQGNVSSSTAVE